MRRSASEKLEIISLVEDSDLGVKRTLEELGINRSTFYEWYRSYLEHGFEGLKPKVPNRKSFWNKIPDEERNKVVELALERTELSPRELAYHITDNQGWFISESSVYRILKERGPITSPAWILMAAADEFKDKTTYVHQQWRAILPILRSLAGVGITLLQSWMISLATLLPGNYAKTWKPMMPKGLWV